MPFSPLKYPNTIILFLICISTSTPTHSTASELAIGNGGGQFLALKQAIETALKNHPIVQEATAGVIASNARTEQALSLYYSQVYAKADGAAGSGRINPRFVTPAGGLLQPNLSQYTAGLLASQRVYDFGYTMS